MTVKELQQALSHCKPETEVYMSKNTGYWSLIDIVPMWTAEHGNRYIEFNDATGDDDIGKSVHIIVLT